MNGGRCREPEALAEPRRWKSAILSPQLVALSGSSLRFWVLAPAAIHNAASACGSGCVLTRLAPAAQSVSLERSLHNRLRRINHLHQIEPGNLHLSSMFVRNSTGPIEL